MLKVFFETFGCQMNVADSEMVKELLQNYGYRLENKSEKADLIIVNTCSVRKHAENRAMTRLSEYAMKKSNDQQLWVIGCMAQRLGDSLKKEIPAIDRVIGAKSIENIELTLQNYLGNRISSPFLNDSRNSISDFLPVMRGCNNYCAYCIVPYVRGKEHSIPAEKILEKARKKVRNGTKEIVLLGQNVNSYNDGSYDFSDLLTQMHKIEELKRIRFTTSHPKDIGEKLINTVAELPKICKHIHLPVQSGSTNILKSMNRRYSSKDYLNKIELIKKKILNVDITTDAMVGFPGETDLDFQQTLTLFQQVHFTSAFMFAYSKRTGTKAAEMPNQVPDTIMKERLNTLISIQIDITKKHYMKMVGGTVNVLFTQKQNQKNQAWMGQDYGCKRILLDCQDDLSGRILKVHVLKSTGMTLITERLAG